MCLSSSASTRKQEKAPIAAGGGRKGSETAGLAGREVNGDGRERRGERNSLSDSMSFFMIFLLLGKHTDFWVQHLGPNQRRLL